MPNIVTAEPGESISASLHAYSVTYAPGVHKYTYYVFDPSRGFVMPNFRPGSGTGPTAPPVPMVKFGVPGAVVVNVGTALDVAWEAWAARELAQIQRLRQSTTPDQDQERKDEILAIAEAIMQTQTQTQTKVATRVKTKVMRQASTARTRIHAYSRRNKK